LPLPLTVGMVVTDGSLTRTAKEPLWFSKTEEVPLLFPGRGTLTNK